MLMIQMEIKIGCVYLKNSWNKLIFACWYKFGKAKSYFNKFWVVLSKNGRGFLGLEMLKSAEEVILKK